MDNEIPHYPAHMTREQQREAKERRNGLASAIKLGSKRHGWRHSGGFLYRQHGNWFVDASVHPLWQSGVLARLHIKPMSIDPLFWRIVGLPENEQLPLSFRARGAWTVRMSEIEAHLAPKIAALDLLADGFWTWAAEQLALCETKSIDGLLDEIVRLGPRRHFAAAEICLRLLNGDREGALELCADHGPYDAGGFSAGKRTFFDMAAEWIATSGQIKVLSH